MLAAAASDAPAQPGQDRLLRTRAQRPESDISTLWEQPAPEREGFEWGAWSAPALLDFSEVDLDASTADSLKRVIVLDQRLWGRWDWEDGTSFFTRVRYLDLRYELGTGTTAPAIFEEGLSLELAHVDFQRGAWSFRVGRQYANLESGLVLDTNLDGIKASYDRGQFSGEIFAGRTPSYVTDLDSFVGRSNRQFAGLHLQFRTEEDHRFFGYLLDQYERGSPIASGQDLTYDSRYLAAGAEGPLFGDLFYFAEAIRESGRSASAGAGRGPSPIDADALVLDVTWRPDRKHHPTLSLGLALGSGDRDRNSVISTFDGNRPGTEDNAFIGLGQFEGGLALTPRLSNLLVYSLAGTYKPFEPPHDDDSLLVGAAGYLYRKEDPAGPISHAAGNQLSDDVGKALDLFASWKPSHDLTFSVHAGRFLPGEAFDIQNRSAATVLYGSLTFDY